MKRKRGHKKLSLTAETTTISANQDEEMSANSEENSGSEEENDDNKAEIEPQPEVESRATKVETPPEKVEKEVAIVRPEVVFQRPPTTAVYGRVKVKLKTSKPIAIEPQQLPSSDAPARTDYTDKSTQQALSVDKSTQQAVSLGKSTQQVVSVDKSTQQVVSVDKSTQQVVNVDKQRGFEKMAEKGEESANSLPESKKSGGIKIVSGKGLSPPGRKESSPSGLVLEKKKEEQEPKVLRQGSRYNKKELEASLEVVKKVMKMDAAEPFNVPVNPIELGIPDYFDIIDTPMDFGTVRSNLESGGKYLNSEDVFKDVQYIWNNCYKYNNKGDYIVDLMKRVKNNFMKYWVAAGLYTEQSRKQTGGEGTPLDEATTSGYGKKVKRGKGVKRHKDDCMCAICIMKRRRKEREAREAHGARETGAQATSPRTEVGKASLPSGYKQENSHVESPFGEDTSSYLETSPDVDVDAEMEDGEETRLESVTPRYGDEHKAEENRLEIRDKSERSEDVSDRPQRSDKVETESYSHGETNIHDESANGAKNYAQGQPLVHLDGQIAEHIQQRNELLELEKKRQKLRLLETFRDLENPVLFGLCSTLFPSNPRSVWNGANSLIRSDKTHNIRSGIHDAIASFMTPSSKSSSSLK